MSSSIETEKLALFFGLATLSLYIIKAIFIKPDNPIFWIGVGLNIILAIMALYFGNKSRATKQGAIAISRGMIYLITVAYSLLTILLG
jgi:hypothetical protein